MIDNLNPYIQFIIASSMLIFGSNMLIDNCKLLAEKFNISKFIIGVTVLALGTSLPELVVSLSAILKVPPESDIVIGNIIGSNISNICLVLGLVLIFFKFQIKNIINTKLSSIYLSIVSVIFYYFIYRGQLNLVNGIVLLACFLVYLYVITKYFSYKGETRNSTVYKTTVKLIFLISLGAFFLSVGSSLFLDGAVGIAIKIGVNNSVIGLTLVALGTSIPELFVSINSAIKKEFDFVIGNVIGSNIINIVLVGGVTSLLNLLTFTEGDFKIFNPLSLSLSFLLIFLFFEKPLINKFIGATFIVIYLIFLYINFS